MKRQLISLGSGLVLLSCAQAANPGGTQLSQSGPADYRGLDSRFTSEVRPVLETYCFSCHAGSDPASMLDLTTFRNSADIVSGFGTWDHVYQRLEAGEMPPRGMPQPSADERSKVVEYVVALRDYEANRNAGDPGVVLAHRLSNAELNYTILDLTGMDIQPAREFPVDPANEAGFDNTGETLAISPALLSRQLDAARKVAEHIVFQPRGFSFAPHVVVSEPDRDRFVVNRIMDFYRRQPTDLAKYFFALWRYENRAALGQPNATLDQIAAEEGVAARYLGTVRDFMQTTRVAVGPIAGLRQRWEALPRPTTNGDLAAVRTGTQQLRDYVIAARKKVAYTFPVPRANPLHIASQTLQMHVNRLGVAHRRSLNTEFLVAADQPLPGTDPDLVIPADPARQAEAIEALRKFADVFPDAFLVTERTSTWLAANQSGRLLSAGFHSMMGYFRDDGPLYDMILNEEQRREIDTLWDELNFISDAPSRQLSAFVWFERTDSRMLLEEQFNQFRAEDKDLGSAEKFAELRRLYMAKLEPTALRQEYKDAVDLFFQELGDAIRWTERERIAAEPFHLTSLVEFAERAYRRSLTQPERDDLIAFYQMLRTEDGLTHEDAIRDAVVSVLVSPNFSYRVDLAQNVRPTRVGGTQVAPLTDEALASRLSYFLWSSMPDAELLAHAKAGDLHKPEVLRAQVRRMLRDEKISRLATEFGTNWLGVRRFEEFNAVSRERYPTFSNELRESFFQEPIHFIAEMIREDRPVLDLLFGNYTYVNPLLASHYGMPAPAVEGDEWVRVDNAGEYGRGGILPMAVFQTNYSPGLRTSPVKRGHWVASKVLGQHIPAPPPNVPQLPADEADLGGLSLPQLMARHRQDPSCASCHATFDHFGLVFEGFGPAGERRQTDLGGRAVETTADFPNGTRGDGLQGLRDYLRSERQDDFVDNVSRRLLTYALGRGLLLSDNRLLSEMKAELAADEYRFSSLVETIVTSPQFLTKRVSDGSGSVAHNLDD